MRAHLLICKKYLSERLFTTAKIFTAKIVRINLNGKTLLYSEGRQYIQQQKLIVMITLLPMEAKEQIIS